MDHFAGLDVSVKYTGDCIVDSMGFGSFKVASEPDALLQVLRNSITALSGSDWNLGRYRNGCSARLVKQTPNATGQAGPR